MEKRNIREEMMQEDIPETSEGRRQKLSDMLDTADQTAKKVKTDSIVNKQQLNSAKQEMMAGFMTMLTNLGVDLQDVDAITEFLEEVERTDPALADMFEAVFDSIDNVGEPIEREEEEVVEEEPIGRMPKMPVKRLGRAAEASGTLPPAPASPGGRTPSDFKNLMGGL